MFITDDGIDVRTLSTADLSRAVGDAIKARAHYDLEILTAELNRRDKAARAR
jgi:hypothetical protein